MKSPTGASSSSTGRQRRREQCLFFRPELLVSISVFRRSTTVLDRDDEADSYAGRITAPLASRFSDRASAAAGLLPYPGEQ